MIEERERENNVIGINISCPLYIFSNIHGFMPAYC